MTDNEIINGLKGIASYTGFTDPIRKVLESALDLINRQKAEIEKLTTQFRDLDIECERLEKANENLKAERGYFKALYEASKEEHLELIKTIKDVEDKARKEFTKRLKEKSKYYENGEGYEGFIIYVIDLDNLLKEFEKK